MVKWRGRKHFSICNLLHSYNPVIWSGVSTANLKLATMGEVTGLIHGPAFTSFMYGKCWIFVIFEKGGCTVLTSLFSILGNNNTGQMKIKRYGIGVSSDNIYFYRRPEYTLIF